MRDYQTKVNVGSLPDSITTTKFGAGEFNSIAVELENSVIRSGQTLANASGTGESSTQLAQSLFHHATRAQTWIDSGTLNSYVLTPINGANGFLVPANLTLLDGMRVTFFPHGANTGAATLNIGQTGGTLLGSKPLRTNANVELSAGQIGTREVSAVYNLSLDAWLLAPWGMNASETERGVLELSSLAEAQAGTDHTTAMTPLRVRNALNQFGIANDTTNIITDANTILTSGLYGTDAAVTANLPSGASQTGVLLVMTRAGTTRVFQEYLESNFRKFVRSYNSGTLTWTAWFEFWIGTNNAAFNNAQAGYQALPSGIIVQWGRFSFAAGTTGTVSLPLTFPSANHIVTITGLSASDLGRFQTTANTTSNFSWARFGSTTSGSAQFFCVGV